MFGATTSEAFLGIRIPKELETRLTQAADSINKHEDRYWNRLNKSRLARQIIEAFFSGDTELKKKLAVASKKSKK